jgi:MSHA biogenesis protein MshL
MALLSGTKGNLRVGENITIVSKVGAAQGVGGTVTTVETNQIKTGFELGLFGEVHEGSVYTKVSINLSDLVKIEEKKVQGTDLTLPTISERVVNTIMRARPGDVVILGGISSKRENGDVVNNLGQSAKTESNNRSEIVIALRPRVLHFIPSGTSSSSKKDVLLPAETIRSPKLVESNKVVNSSESKTENP